jgi:hypothetical protein
MIQDLTRAGEAALGYARRGWPVFFCSSNDKRPLTPNGFKDATCDEARIRAAAERFPEAMIAVATGAPIGAFVVDLDPKDGVSADDLLEELRLRCGGKLPPCPMVRTPRGGLHLYFAMPPGVAIGNRAGFLPMCDIRGAGGYVILPPSVRRGPKAVREGCDGVAYGWEEDSGLDEFDPPEPPAALVLMAVSRDQGKAPPADDDRPARSRAAPRPVLGERERRYALAAFDAEIRAAQTAGKGQRNNALNTAALKLGSLVAAGALSERLVQAALEDAAEVSGLVRDDGWRSVRATIASGLKAGLAAPRDLSAVKAEDRNPAPRKDLPNPPDRSGAPQPPRPLSGPDGDGQPPEGPSLEDEDPRRVVRLRNGRLHEAIGEIEAIMEEAGAGPVYQRSGELVHVVRRPVRRSDGFEEIREAVGNIGQAGVLCEWARKIRFERFDGRTRKWFPADPPAKLAEAYFEQSRWRLPNLHHLIATPTLRPDGTLLAKRGYDERTGFFLTCELPGLKVPDRPSKDDAEAALETLTQLFAEFPYADRDDELRAGLGLSVALAGLIGAVLRASLPSAPLIGVTAPKAGTGKSYLVDLISIIAIGQRAPCVVSGVTPEEFQKSLGASLLASAPLLSLDNMVQPLGGQLLCMILTQERVDMRVLGLSKMAENLPTATAMFATGNNLKLVGDLTRRALLCRLDARQECPEERSFTTDLLAEAYRRRAELVSAVLTIARWGFIRRENRTDWSLDDPGKGKAFAGFETWCRRVRDPLIALGCRDPVAAMDDVRASDPLGERLRILVNAWDAELGGRSLTCKEAVYHAAGGTGELTDAMIAVSGEQQGEVNKHRLGKFLSAHEGAIADGKAFYRDGSSKNAVRWQLRNIGRGELGS